MAKGGQEGDITMADSWAPCAAMEALAYSESWHMEPRDLSKVALEIHVGRVDHHAPSNQHQAGVT